MDMIALNWQPSVKTFDELQELQADEYHARYVEDRDLVYLFMCGRWICLADSPDTLLGTSLSKDERVRVTDPEIEYANDGRMLNLDPNPGPRD